MEKYWSIKDLGLIVFIAIISLSFALLLLSLIETENPVSILIFEFILYGSILGTIIYLVYKKKGVLEEFIFNDFSLKYFFISLLLSLVVVFLGGFLSKLLSDFFSLQNGTSDFLKESISDNLWINILSLKLMAAIFVPIVEEVLFRGVLFKYIRQSKPFLFSAVLSSLIFALIHFNLASFVFLFVLGFAAAFMLEKTKSVFYPIIIHVVVNNLAVSMLFWGTLSG